MKKIFFKSISQPDQNSEVTIPFPLYSDNRKFKLDFYKETINNTDYTRFDILNTVNGEVYFSLLDNTLSSQMPIPTTQFRLNNQGHIIVYTNNTFSADLQNTNSFYWKYPANYTFAPPYTLSIENDGALTIKDKNNIEVANTKYESWRSFRTKFSVEILSENDSVQPNFPYKVPNTPDTLDPTDSILYKYSKHLSNKKKFIDFFPFKVVPLSYLIALGKVTNTGQSPFYFVNFTGNENYLPIGELAYPGAEGTTFPSDTNKILVALIKNDEKYSFKIPTSDYYNIDCNFSSISHKIIRNTYNCNQCEVLGCLTRNRTLGRPSNSTENLAAVVNTFLYKIEDAKLLAFSSCYLITPLLSKTPFYTYTVNLGVDDIPKPKNDCFDLLPATCILDLYTGEFSYAQFTISDVQANAVANIICNSNSSSFTDDLCINYYKTSIDSPYNYDSRFFEFCKAKDTLGQFNYQNPYFKSICACYNPDQVYQDYINQILEGLPEEQRKQLESAVSQPPPCFYPACAVESINSVPRWNFKRGDRCTDNAIQVCLNKNDIKIEGTLTGDVSTDSIINCLQQNIRDSPTTPPPGGNGTKKSSNTLWIVLGIVFVVLIILYFTVFKK